MRLADSTGFYFPDYTRRKLPDPQDTHEIIRYMSAKGVEAAAHTARETDMMPPDFEELVRLGRPWRVMVYKKTIGRVMSVTAMPVFRNSFSLRNDTLVSADSLRFKEVFALAIR